MSDSQVADDAAVEVMPRTAAEWRELWINTAKLAEELVLELQRNCGAKEHTEQLAWLRIWRDRVEGL